ncbi:c-type cytochrome [Stenotrophomonas rhizophila]|uniref:Mono/diheme cytochrome c family protein n=1 Tax=Stenotrophomonas rhizophila TaxID=216778 RepID=A0AAW5PGH5_9GAMM|nr:c-type cytochrome [Stenotrophomonas rhizophila]MCS4279252.1 mono/diheme cytochrome c family protein [Stenotrophomonas rhizophila]
MKAFLLIALSLLAGVSHTARADDTIERGRYLSVAADCVACHTSPKQGKPYAGGYAIASPLGEIWASNITPSTSHGIGNYTEADFAKAVREGVRKDGAHLYPAMPYTSYAKLTDEDIHALYVYFMQAVAPVDEEARTTELPFPFSVRSSMAVWNLLFLDKTPFKPDPAQSAQWNRGAYLVEGLAHCSSCHSPRGLMMQEVGGKAFAGGSLGDWYAPNITSHPISGIGGWTDDELAQYLKTGRVEGKGQAGGGMAEAVSNSLSKLRDDDISAIVTYLRTVPAVADKDATRAAFAWGDAATAPGEPAIRGTDAPIASGAVLYSGLCASCHGSRGEGSNDGYYPSLVHNSTVGMVRPQNLVATIIGGIDREVDGKHVVMPHFSEGSYVQALSDADIAAVASYVRTTFGPGDQVTAAQVALIRDGGEKPLLAKIARLWLPLLILALAAFVVVILLVRRAWTRRKQRRASA